MLGGRSSGSCFLNDFRRVSLADLETQPIVLKERLPAHQKAIKEKAESEGLITTTYNCNVKVFTKTNEGHFRSIPINSLKAVEDIKDRAVKKQRY